ncbi:MAG: 4Fe-4S binding protein [Actinomycetota bacterium]|nr:4Fe-4S binding protein [Actinomycetota bacterium]
MTVRVLASCTACGACLVTCPERVLHRAPGRPRVEDDRCTDCLACIEICPVDAIQAVPSSPGDGS